VSIEEPQGRGLVGAPGLSLIGIFTKVPPERRILVLYNDKYRHRDIAIVGYFSDRPCILIFNGVEF